MNTGTASYFDCDGHNNKNNSTTNNSNNDLMLLGLLFKVKV